MAYDEALLSEIRNLSKKIDVLTTIIAATLLKDKQPTEQISILLELGLETSEIATVLRKPSNYVGSIKSRLSKKNSKMNNAGE